MFLFRRRVAAEPEAAPVAPPLLDIDEFDEKVKRFNKWSTIGFAGYFAWLLISLYLLKFSIQPDVENFERQPMDQYHRFMGAILLLLFMVVLYQIIFVGYERAQTVMLMATPLFVSPLFD